MKTSAEVLARMAELKGEPAPEDIWDENGIRQAALQKMKDQRDRDWWMEFNDELPEHSAAPEQKSGEPDMNINDVISADDRFLKAPDLQGRKVSVRIESFTVENFKEKKQIVLKFFGAKKVLGLNKINTKMIASMHGDETDNWIGKEVLLFPSKTQNQQGQIVDCVRIEFQPPQPPQQFVSGLAGGGHQPMTATFTPRGGASPSQQFNERNPPPAGHVAADDMSDPIQF